jgi:hypothetical protein
MSPLFVVVVVLVASPLMFSVCSAIIAEGKGSPEAHMLAGLVALAALAGSYWLVTKAWVW